MKRILLGSAISLLLLIAIGAGVRVVQLSTSASAKDLPPVKENTAARQPGNVVVACPGRLEGRSDTVAVGAAIDGILQTVHVREGQTVSRGQLLAEIGCSDIQASLRVARAEAESTRQARVRLLRGSREEERQAAAQRTAAARAILDQATSHASRTQKLWEAEDVSRAAYDEARRDYEVAQAGLKQAMRTEELTNAEPLAEDVARVDADVRAAEERIKLAEDKLGKCTVRAPIDGTILRVHLREGESFALLAPRPLFSVADVSGRRVRAEVDERDVEKVRVGQKVVVTSDAHPEQRFEGKVTRISSIMGRKSVLTGDPVDKTDRDILEATAELEPAAQALPLGLRVAVQFVR